MTSEELYPCIGVCLPDEDAAYCIGCGRPWGTPSPEGAVPPAPTFVDDAEPAPA